MAKSIQILSTKILSPVQKQELTKAGIEVIEADFIKTENKPLNLKTLNESFDFHQSKCRSKCFIRSKIGRIKKQKRLLRWFKNKNSFV